MNSDPENVARNSGIFWAMLEASLLVGNTFAYFQFRGLDTIEEDTRVTTVGVLLAVGIAGCVTFCTFLPTPWAKEVPGPFPRLRTTK